MIEVDEIVRGGMIVRVTRSMTQAVSTTVTTEAIIADVRSFLGELKCVGSERLLRMGISMAQLHVLHLLERHGELAMSRLAETLNVSLSAATGLVDGYHRGPHRRRSQLLGRAEMRRERTTSADGHQHGAVARIAPARAAR